MSLLDSMKYGRPCMTNLSYEDFMRIKNTPPPDLTALYEESERIKAKILKMRGQKNAGTSE